MYTNYQGNDGFGAQYQKIIQTYICCKLWGVEFLYRPLDKVEHNYNRDRTFNEKLENLMNLRNNIKNDVELIAVPLDYGQLVWPWYEEFMEIYSQSEHMDFIKKCFWANKDRNFFKNNKINIAVHIRRDNPYDNGMAGERTSTPDSYYLDIMNQIRAENKGKELLFHIYSQGYRANFSDYIAEDVVFHIDESVDTSFIGLVAADILLTSASSFSYVAALISDGKIYYKHFWHKPRQHWIVAG